MTFTRPCHIPTSVRLLPFAKFVLTWLPRISAWLFLEFLCLSYSTLLFSCQSASDTSKEAASLAGQLTHISTIAMFRQAFFAAFLIFFMFFREKNLRIHHANIPIHNILWRAAPNPLLAGKKMPPCGEDGAMILLFAARTSLAIARAVGRGLACCRIHGARPFTGCDRAAGGTADLVRILSEFIELFAAGGTDILEDGHTFTSIPCASCARTNLYGRPPHDAPCRADRAFSAWAS